MAENAFKADWPSFALGFNTGKSKGGVELNIAYGDTPPEDDSKLWCKTTKPSGVVMTEYADAIVLSEKMPEAHSEAGSAVVGSKIYVMQGRDYTGAASNKSFCFDTENETVSVLPDAPEPNVAPGAAAVGSKIYLFGGSSVKTGIYVFDTQSQSYTKCGATLPERRVFTSCEAVGDFVYIFGGGEDSFNTSRNTIYRYDTINDEITELPITLPNSTGGMGSVVIGSKIYLFGGSASTTGARAESYCFDTETETILSIEKLPTSLCCFGCAEVDGNIYILGGTSMYAVDSKSVNTVYRYDVDANTYTKLSYTLAGKLKNMACEAVNSQIYLLGGKKGDSYNNRSIERVSLRPRIDKDALLIQTKTGSSRVKLINMETLSAEFSVFATYQGNEVNEGEPVESAIYNGTKWATI